MEEADALGTSEGLEHHQFEGQSMESSRGSSGARAPLGDLTNTSIPGGISHIQHDKNNGLQTTNIVKALQQFSDSNIPESSDGPCDAGDDSLTCAERQAGRATGDKNAAKNERRRELDKARRAEMSPRLPPLGRAAQLQPYVTFTVRSLLSPLSVFAFSIEIHHSYVVLDVLRRSSGHDMLTDHDFLPGMFKNVNHIAGTQELQQNSKRYISRMHKINNDHYPVDMWPLCLFVKIAPKHWRLEINFIQDVV